MNFISFINKYFNLNLFNLLVFENRCRELKRLEITPP
jgi:hypothetical protein